MKGVLLHVMASSNDIVHRDIVIYKTIISPSKKIKDALTFPNFTLNLKSRMQSSQDFYTVICILLCKTIDNIIKVVQIPSSFYVWFPNQEFYVPTECSLKGFATFGEFSFYGQKKVADYEYHSLFAEKIHFHT